MRHRNQRMKASDVFRETEFLFSSKASFDKAFPEIEDVVIEVTEDGRGIRQWRPSHQKRIYRKSNLPGEYVDCSNPLCCNGGISVGSMIRDMVRARTTEKEASEVCRGYEGSPKGRRKYGNCMNFFEVKIAITYKGQATEPVSS